MAEKHDCVLEITENPIVISIGRIESRNLNFIKFACNMNKDRNIDIMGVVNLTDDSYFAQSRCAGIEQTLARVGCMIDEGTTIIDIGACSTRPGAEILGPELEWERLSGVLPEIRKSFPEVLISIDTFWSEVVRKAYGQIGGFIVNDISAGEDDPRMLPLVGSLGLKYVAMHKRGTPQNMQSLTDYDDVTGSVLAYFNEFAQKADRFGIKDWVLDPGFGFAKTIEQNYQLLAHLDHLSVLDRPVLVGVSRKSMIYKYFGITPEESLAATQVLHMKALQQGASILRVHDVAEAARTIALYRILD